MLFSSRTLALASLSATVAPAALAHIALFHPAMYGFNITGSTNTPAYPNQDNRPVVPLAGRKFSEWWYHGHLDYPPHPTDILKLTPGKATTVELACDKGATSWWKSSAGSTYLQTGDENNPCPGYPMSQYHTKSKEDTGGCALAVSYKSKATDVKPEDFTIFSAKSECVWKRYTAFETPAEMPPCPIDERTGKRMCQCAWFWIHRADSGSEQMFMTGFQCDFPGATGTKPVGKGKVAKRCGADEYERVQAKPSNCTQGPKLPMYWYQKEGNNMKEGTYTPPLYRPLYNFHDGAQNDIFVDGTVPGSSGGGSGNTKPSSSKAAPAPTTTSAANNQHNVKPTSSNVSPPKGTQSAGTCHKKPGSHSKRSSAGKARHLAQRGAHPNGHNAAPGLL